jgi:hypothetical protein
MKDVGLSIGMKFHISVEGCHSNIETFDQINNIIIALALN